MVPAPLSRACRMLFRACECLASPYKSFLWQSGAALSSRTVLLTLFTRIASVTRAKLKENSLLPSKSHRGEELHRMMRRSLWAKAFWLRSLNNQGMDRCLSVWVFKTNLPFSSLLSLSWKRKWSASRSTTGANRSAFWIHSMSEKMWQKFRAPESRRRRVQQECWWKSQPQKKVWGDISVLLHVLLSAALCNEIANKIVQPLRVHWKIRLRGLTGLVKRFATVYEVAHWPKWP